MLLVFQVFDLFNFTGSECELTTLYKPTLDRFFLWLFTFLKHLNEQLLIASKSFLSLTLQFIFSIKYIIEARKHIHYHHQSPL